MAPTTTPRAGTAAKLGPGLFKVGETGSDVEFGIQCTKMQVEVKVKDGDRIPVLSGYEHAGDDEVEWTIGGSLLEDYSLESLQLWAHLNRGKELPFTFRPDNDKALAIRGVVKVNPIGLGGDVKKRNEVDFEFTGVDFYDYIDADTGEVISEYGQQSATPAPSDGDW